jgi:hypothetical protein
MILLGQPDLESIASRDTKNAKALAGQGCRTLRQGRLLRRGEVAKLRDGLGRSLCRNHNFIAVPSAPGVTYSQESWR